MNEAEFEALIARITAELHERLAAPVRAVRALASSLGPVRAMRALASATRPLARSGRRWGYKGKAQTRRLTGPSVASRQDPGESRKGKQGNLGNGENASRGVVELRDLSRLASLAGPHYLLYTVHCTHCSQRRQRRQLPHRTPSYR